jgi:dipeptidase
VTKIYGGSPERSPRSDMERELRAAAPIDLRRMMDAVRDPRISMDSTGYGQVAQLKDNGRADMNLLWIAPTQSVTAPFIPYRVGVQEIAPQFGKHRYLTKGEARRFLNSDWQIQEATEFAGRTFKRLMYYTCDHPEKFLPEVTEALTAFENRLMSEQVTVTETANELFAAGKEDLARNYLTDYSWQSGKDALRLGNALLASIEARTAEIYGLRTPQDDTTSELGGKRVDCLP